MSRCIIKGKRVSSGDFPNAVFRWLHFVPVSPCFCSVVTVAADTGGTTGQGADDCSAWLHSFSHSRERRKTMVTKQSQKSNQRSIRTRHQCWQRAGIRLGAPRTIPEADKQGVGNKQQEPKHTGFVCKTLGSSAKTIPLIEQSAGINSYHVIYYFF